MFVIRASVMVVTLIGLVSRAEAQTTTTTLPPTSYLKCYKAKDPLTVRGPAPAWLQLDSGGVDGVSNCRIVGSFRLVCVPASGTVTAPIEGRMGSGQFLPLTPLTLPMEEALAQDRLCYKVRCLEPPAIDPQTAFTDTFGARQLSRYKPLLACGPAIASLCGDGNLDFGEDCDDGNRTSGDCCSATCRAEPAAQSCGPDSDGNACTTPRCDGVGFCDQTAFLEPTTTVCPDSDGNVCTRARCNGAGACSQTGFLEPTTSLCPDTDTNACTSARCNGTGTCNQLGFLAPVSAPCPDVDGNDCSQARCNGGGSCNQAGVVFADGTPCSDVDGNLCTAAQCAAGTCNQSVAVPVGSFCPDVDVDQCTRSGCDEVGACAQDFFVRNCTMPETCQPGTGICQ